jgi:hypothetical protein
MAMNSRLGLLMTDASRSCIPNARISNEPDGCVRIRIGEGNMMVEGVVSSHHLVEPRINQLRTAWLNKQHGIKR